MDQKELKKYLGYCRAVARSYSRKVDPSVFTYEDLYSAAEEGLALAIAKRNPASEGFSAYTWQYIKGYVRVALRKRMQDQSRCYTTLDDDSQQINFVDSIAVDATQDETVDYRNLLAGIKRQIDNLPRAERDYAILTLVEGYNGSETAQRLGISTQRIAQIRKTVINKLKKWNRAA
jgi:RNA polymerase sigma factor (sigma-70 family)